jgi:Asp-tRNA(Asn)/Glu-tRNA(Gln) amidotransferase A subunit family amidase
LQAADLSGLRIATTEDFGICAVDADIRRVFRDRVAALAPLVRSCEPLALDVGEAHRAFDILRAEAFVAAFADVYRTAPESLGPNVRANVEMAASITLADRAWAHLEQTRMLRRFASAFEQYDLILSPVSPVSPFPWTRLYAETVDGQAMDNYYQWLALTYVITLTTHPALSLPCGIDEQGLPFGLQITGRLNGDAALLSAAQAIEQAFKDSPRTARPLPDLSRLQQPCPELRGIVTDPPDPELARGVLRSGSISSSAGVTAT